MATTRTSRKQLREPALESAITTVAFLALWLVGPAVSPSLVTFPTVQLASARPGPVLEVTLFFGTAKAMTRLAQQEAELATLKNLTAVIDMECQGWSSR
jgi:hypothetical protein